MFLLWCVSASFLSRVDVNGLDQELKDRPVSKVLKLLEEMRTTLQKEGEADQEIYDKLACWCETNDKEKTEAQSIAQNRITALTSAIEEGTAKSSRLSSEISQLNDEIEKNTAALNKASAIRTKELAEFNGEEKDMLQSVQALGNAVTVLSKHHELPAEALVNVATIIRHHMHVRESVLLDIMSVHQKKTITAFLQQPAGFQSYAPASGEIFGILKQMKETFESNLSTSQKEEMEARDAFAQLKAAKESEIQAAQRQVQNKQVELADTDEANAQNKQDLEDTRNALSADTKFLLDLKEKCSQTDAEMASRTKTRNEEIMAVGEAIKILSDDDAHDLMGKTLGFAQVKSVRGSQARNTAVALLKAAAKKSGNSALAELASVAQLDAFDGVRKAIDEMVVALEKEKADEIKHRDFCIAEFAENDKQTAVQTDEKGDLEASIADLSNQIETLTDDLAQLQAEIKESNVQTKRASEDRELENTEFQSTVADQRATQAILTKALNRLKQFYEKFLQTKATKARQPEPGAEAPAAPAGFKSYENNSASGGVMGMLQGIINDAKNMEREALRAENDSQGAYESFVKNTNDSIAAANKEIVAKTENKARAEKEKVQAEADHKASMTDLENLSAYKAQLHQSCDFVMNNFDVRQEARDQEVEALRQAKAVLSGADFQ